MTITPTDFTPAFLQGLADLINTLPAVAPPKTFYVSPTGADTNAGTQAAPFKTINGAITKVGGSGVTIVALPGTYNEAVVVTKGGDVTGDLILKSATPGAALIRSNSGPGINIQQSYLTIDGFDVTTTGGGHGIEATFLNGNTALNGPYHLTITNNICHDNGGGGIVLAYGDWYAITNNTCYNNCATNTYQPSGISIYEPRPTDNVTTPQLRILISHNKSYNNIYTAVGAHSDGNGIIIDDFRSTQQTVHQPYPHKTLVERNLCWSNGGKGVHVFYSDNVLVQFNTCYGNNKDNANTGTWRGELNNAFGNNNKWIKNIGYALSALNKNNTAFLDGNSTGTLWQENIFFDGTTGVGVDPKFVSLGIPPDFRTMVGLNAGAYA